MSHVDDGTLHAFLDGALPRGEAATMAVEAHLALCADCRARLERERALKARAGEVLGAASPGAVDIPPFEEILARRGSQATSPPPATRAGGRVRGPARSPVPLAWAASVVLALGAGWMAHALRDAGEVPPAQRATESAPTADISADAVTDVAGEASADASSGAGNAAAPVEETTTPPATVDVGTAAEQRSAAAPPPTTSSAAAPPPAVPQAEPPPSAPPRVDTSAAAAAADRAAAQRVLEQTLPAERMSLAASGAAAFANVAPREEMRVWTLVSRPEAEAHLGTVPARLEGVEMLGTYTGTAGDSALVRTLYRLADGRMVETVEQSRVALRLEALAPPAAEAAGRERQAAATTTKAADSAAPAQLSFGLAARLGASVLIVQRPATVLRLRADLPADSLASLAARIR